MIQSTLPSPDLFAAARGSGNFEQEPPVARTTDAVRSGVGGVLRSVYEDQHDILEAIRQLHCPEGYEADLTFGNGSFWKRLPRPKYCFDVTPLHEGVVQSDSRMLPLAPASLSNAVFDPPFLTYVQAGRAHKEGKVAMTARFGGYYRYDELEDHYRDTISECYRVLRPKGKLVFKCQDIIHNHRMHCTHVKVIQMAEIEGFRLADLFVLPARHRMPSPQRGIQRHARIFHSYFLVFERDASTGGGGAELGANKSKRGTKSGASSQNKQLCNNA
jgi:hypothetical protein